MAQEQLKNKLATQQQRNTAVAAPTETVGAWLKAHQTQLASVLPKHITPERLMRVALNSIQSNPKLLECETGSLISAVMQSAMLGLEPGPLGLCHYVPFKKKVTFVIGYQGLIELFYRSGRVKTVFAAEVREFDDFDFRYGINEKLDHTPAHGDRGDIIGFYAYARMEGDSYRFVYLTKEDVEAYRDKHSAGWKAYKAGYIQDTPWKSDFAAMGCKTAVRRLATWLPKSVEVMQALNEDEAAHNDPFDPTNHNLDLSGMVDASVEVQDEKTSTPETPAQEPPQTPPTDPAAPLTTAGQSALFEKK